MRTYSDTLSCDMNTLNDLRSSHDYYRKQLKHNSSSKEDGKFVEDAKAGEGDQFYEEQGQTIQPAESHESFSLEIPNIVFYILGIIILIVVIFLLYRSGVFKHLFKKKKKKDKKKKEKEEKDDEEEEEEDDLSIDHDDFEERIEDSQAQEDWNKSIRLSYLQTLRHLHETGIVEWQRHKTPTEYSIEARNASFGRMTAIFLRTRYGMFEADRTLYEEVKSLSDSILQTPVHEN